ncbi:MAG: MFS transporter [Hyphomicrobium sp.]|uniref:MFS transporter n=1 Tax=Hyphomicrobium sp. TaxID=82 RepID=UPI0039E678D4
MALMPAVTVVPPFQLLIIVLLAFLTVVDLFATQALLPTLAAHYRVSPAAMGLAVNACTLGMAIGGLSIALLSQHINRRTGILASLLVLSIPTFLLAYAPNLAIFASLRVVQGLCMASAFGLTLAYLGERYTSEQSASAFAAYITGNVASNLVGRFVAAAVVDHAGLAANFFVFSTLNIAGAALVFATIERARMPEIFDPARDSQSEAWWSHIKIPEMRAGFAIGFCILFAFIGTFTYVNFILVSPPLSVGMMTLGFIYFVFLPSIITTPIAGTIARKIGHKPALWIALAVAGTGLPLLVIPSLPAVLTGMVLVAVGTFFAQALATGFVSRAARTNRAAASGIYLASYFTGGLIGSAVLGQIFDRFGWSACVAGIGVSLAVAAWLTQRLNVGADKTQ